MDASETTPQVVQADPASVRYYGKYRGTVVDNIDPVQLGRVMASVPAIPGAVLGWAMPCTPFPVAGTTPLTIPPIDSGVWIEFEAGDVNYPVWSGCFWSAGQTPLLQNPA